MVRMAERESVVCMHGMSLSMCRGIEHRGRSFNSYELATAHSIAHIDSAARARIERKFSVLLWHYALKRSIAAAIPLCRD